MSISTPLPSGQTLVSSALTTAAITQIFGQLTASILTVQFRANWPTGGAPAWGITQDVVFIRALQADSEFARVRDELISTNNSSSVNKTIVYTRLWEITWEFWGPNSFDNARVLKDVALDVDLMHDTLNASKLYLITNVGQPVRAPEPYGDQWWERTNLSMRFNELVVAQLVTPRMASLEVLVETPNGLAEDLTIQHP